MTYLYWCLFWLCTGLLQLVLALDLTPVTKSVGLDSATGMIAALADFNSDRFTDFFVLGSKHSLYLWDSNANSFRQNLITLDVPLPVVKVTVADFNGDGVVDIVSLSQTPDNDDCYLATVHWCNLLHNNTVAVVGHTTLNDTLSGSPLILDYNGDHVADVSSVTCDGSYAVWISQGQRKGFLKKVLISEKGSKVRSSYFIDLDSNCQADLVTFVIADNGLSCFQIFEKENKDISTTVPLPHQIQTMAVIGVPAFADMDGDGRMEVVLFSCYDNECKRTAVHVLYTKKLPSPNVLGCHGDLSWKLEFESVSTINLTTHRPVMVDDIRPVIGDVNLDGFPDILVAAVDNDTTKLYPLIVFGSNQGNKLLPRPVFDGAKYTNMTLQALFFDIGEDGILDLLLVQGDSPASVDGRVTAYKQNLKEDHTFLKVLVFSGFCFSSNCTTQLHGSVLPGATVSFSTTDRNGHKKQSVAVVGGNSDSPLQLPFVLFGLGETPNFIESLTIGAGFSLPSGNGSFRVSSRQWTLLVPNSQVIVFTHPSDDSRSWRVELYLTPSNLVYSTAGVLAATAVVIAIVIALLQAREKYQDTKERKQAKHKFHFNAM